MSIFYTRLSALAIIAASALCRTEGFAAGQASTVPVPPSKSTHVQINDNASNYASLMRNVGTGEVAQIRAELNRTKDAQAALTKLEDLLNREPKNVEAHMLCGTILHYMGYETLADDHYAIIDKLDPTRPQSALAQFRSKLELEGIMAAYEYLRYVEDRFPNDPSVLLMEGMIERLNGNEITAEFYYRTAIEKNPNTPGLATALAALRIQQKRFKDAIELADKDLKLKKDHPAASMAKGQALLMSNRAKEAIPYLRIVFNNSSLDRKEPAELLARAYISNGQLAEAIEPTLVSLSWTSLKDREATERIKQRLIFLMSGAKCSEMVNALQIMLGQISDSDRRAWLCFAVGDVLDKSGCKKQAEETFQQALRLRPGVGRGYYRLGKIKEQEGEYESAYCYYLQANQLDQRDPQVAASNRRFIQRAQNKYDLAGQFKNLLRSIFHSADD